MQKAPHLYQVTAEIRGQILEDLQTQKQPRIGEFEPETLKIAFTKGKPQMGSQKFSPNGFILEFIFPDPVGGTVVLPVFVSSKERIVFLPVPSWVQQNIWQGDISGSYHFESHATELIESYSQLLSESENHKLFQTESDFVKW
jgi:hypothetical protein